MKMGKKSMQLFGIKVMMELLRLLLSVHQSTFAGSGSHFTISNFEMGLKWDVIAIPIWAGFCYTRK